MSIGSLKPFSYSKHAVIENWKLYFLFTFSLRNTSLLANLNCKSICVNLFVSLALYYTQ